MHRHDAIGAGCQYMNSDCHFVMPSGASTHAPSLLRNQSLKRAASLLWALAERPEGSSAAELSRLTGLPAPTTGRLLATLADLGLADLRREGSQWVLGYELSRLARAADPFAAFVDRAAPHLLELARGTGESATIVHARPPNMLEVIAQADAPTLVGLTNWIGRSFRPHASASGKLALATLDDDAVRTYAEAGLERLTRRTITGADELVKEVARARRRGYATTVDELEEGYTGITIPIAQLSAGALLVLGVGGPSSRIDARRRREILPVLHEFAARIGPLL